MLWSNYWRANHSPIITNFYRSNIPIFLQSEIYHWPKIMEKSGKNQLLWRNGTEKDDGGWPRAVLGNIKQKFFGLWKIGSIWTLKSTAWNCLDCEALDTARCGYSRPCHPEPDVLAAHHSLNTTCWLGLCRCASNVYGCRLLRIIVANVNIWKSDHSPFRSWCPLRFEICCFSC